METCHFKNCNSEVKVKGLCKNHYANIHRMLRDKEPEPIDELELWKETSEWDFGRDHSEIEPILDIVDRKKIFKLLKRLLYPTYLKIAIMRYYYGMTLSEIGVELNLSTDRVYRIIGKVIEKMPIVIDSFNQDRLEPTKIELPMQFLPIEAENKEPIEKQRFPRKSYKRINRPKPVAVIFKEEPKKVIEKITRIRVRGVDVTFNTSFQITAQVLKELYNLDLVENHKMWPKQVYVLMSEYLKKFPDNELSVKIRKQFKSLR